MGVFTKQRVIIFVSFVYYIGLAISSFYGISVTGTTVNKHDAMYVLTFNCTCLSKSDFQCFQESIRTGKSVNHIVCNIIEEPDKPDKYELCDCGTHGKYKCFSRKCYVIENLVHVPESCDYGKCDAFNGLDLWMSAAKLGTVIGCVAALVALITMCKAVKTSQDMDFSGIYFISVLALIPPAVIAYSLMTTDVPKYYSNLGLNEWAWMMACGFGIPLCAAWIFCISRIYNIELRF